MVQQVQKYLTESNKLGTLNAAEKDLLLSKSSVSGLYTLALTGNENVQEKHDLSLRMADLTMFQFLDQNGKMPNIHDVKSGVKPEKHQELTLEIDAIEEETIGLDFIEVDGNGDLTFEIADEFNPSIIEPKKDQSNRKKKKSKKKFKLTEYSGISDFSKWLLSYQKVDVEKQIRKEEKWARKMAFEKNAMKSVTKSTEIISEPLAKILASQGHLDDAKKMYEQLMHKYPEKSVYFAAEINNLIKI